MKGPVFVHMPDGAYNASVDKSNSCQPKLCNKTGSVPAGFRVAVQPRACERAGATIGVAQSAGSLARILVPLFAATLYTHVASLPYVFCGMLAILAALLTWQFLCRKNSTSAVVHGIQSQ
jgi:hypothetical protein